MKRYAPVLVVFLFTAFLTLAGIILSQIPAAYQEQQERSAPVVEAPVEEVVGKKPGTLSPLQLLSAEQEEYFAKYGEYKGVLPGKQELLDSGYSFTESGFDTTIIPDNIRINEYEGPGGFGYQVIVYTATSTYSIGIGPEAATRTWVDIKPEPGTASST